MALKTPFNSPHVSGLELEYIQTAIKNLHLSGNGPFTKWCHQWFKENLGTPHALLTHSCTAALEMAAILCDLKEGDEVILPSYTFVSTANAFILRGAKPVFVDIRLDTLNIDEKLIEKAISPRTRAIVPVHYAGVPCEMDTIMDIARKHNLFVVEDAAQAILSSYKGKMLGTIGDFGCLSFHETKNIHCGEGGALLVNNVDYIKRSEIIWEKGTNRSQFFRGEIDKYNWNDLGSSFLPSEMNAAFLRAQLEKAPEINRMRQKIWEEYYSSSEIIEQKNLAQRPSEMVRSQNNGHLFPLIFSDDSLRDKAIKLLKSQNISSVFHYIPLHSSPMGKSVCTKEVNLPITDYVSSRLLRLPLWPDMLKDAGRPSLHLSQLLSEL